MTEGGGDAAPLLATPAGRARRGKLPANPGNMMVRPQQLLQRQRQAERAAAEQDVVALQQVLGGLGAPAHAAGGMGTGSRPASSRPGSSPPGSAGPEGGEDGRLSSLTVQALLPQRAGSQGGVGGGGGQGVLLPAEPSVLTGYIAGLAEDSSMVQRQLTHLQASTSGTAVGGGRGGGGWAAIGSIPVPVQSARNAPGRREVFVLSKWLEVETARFNATYARKDERTPLVDFLLLAASKAKAIYSQAYAELTRQVTVQCEERGRLMADVWIGYAAMLDSVLSRVHAAYAVVKDRAERAEVRLEMAEGQLEQERSSAEGYKIELQDEVARLRAELTAALSMGGGGGHVDVMSAVLGPRGSASSGDGGSRRQTALREGSIAGAAGRSVRFRDSHFSPLSRGSTAGGLSGKRGTLAMEGLRQGSSRISVAMSAVMRQMEESSGTSVMLGVSSSGGMMGDDFDALQQQNMAMKEALDGARQELFDVYKQLADLEAAANEVVLLESRAEAAENERDEAVAMLRATTPRPQTSWEELQGLVGDQGMVRFHAALEAHKHWPTDELALMLVGGLLHSGSNGSLTSRGAGAAPAAAAGVAGSDGGSSSSSSGGGAGGLPFVQQPTVGGEAAAGQQQPLTPSTSSTNVAAAAGQEGAPSGPEGAPPSGALSARGRGASGDSHLCEHVGRALGCLRAAVSQGLLTRETLKQAILERSLRVLTNAADEEDHVDWLAFALSRPVANPDALTDFLAGATRSGLALGPSSYGCMQQYCKLPQGISFDVIRAAVQRARMSTKTRVALLEEEVRAAQKESHELREIVRGYREAEQRRDAARRRREEEAQLEKKNPLQQYVELLGSQEESAWKDFLIGMGQSADVPKLFKHSGKIRNKHLSKRDTEKLVKEIWKERMADPAAAAGKACDLLDFVFQQLQKKVGIVTAVVEAGYNFLFGLWKYQWDADCELFLRILQGEVKEDVYVAQIRLQEEVEELFTAIDKATGQATGFISKDDLRTAFLAYFKVGQSSGKTLKRFDELMQALDEDQEGDTVEWKKVFEEDREFNQGEFAEAIRDQFLQERVEFFKALEEAIYEECGHEEECTREHTVQALLRVDLDMTEKAAQQTAAAIFSAGLELLSVKAVMRKLSRGVVRKGRGSSASATRLSAMGASGPAGKMGRTNSTKKAVGAATGVPSESIMRALEALRQEWIAREVQKTAKAG